MRLELIHPMLVHFPIALLLTGSLVRFAALWRAKKPILSFLLPAAWMILLFGVIAAWLAVIAGEMALKIVGPTLENLAVLDTHQHHAYITAYGFTIGLLLDWARAILLPKLPKKSRIIKTTLIVFVSFFYLFSVSNLIITGSYGAILVYQEGAAVAKKNP